MTGGEKTGAIAACLLFGGAFGAVGVFASWVIVTTLSEGYSAREWVKVPANVLQYDGNGLRYRYDIDGRLYDGTRVGLGFLENSEIDNEVEQRLTQAVNDKKPVTVFMNPENPAQSVVDPRIPWMLVVGMTPFALAFGGVGVGALFFLGKILTDSDDKPRPQARVRVASAMSGALGLLVFAFFWNALAIPISIIAVPQILKSGEWLGLLILIFPLIGLFLIWGALSAAWQALRRGRVTIEIAGGERRVGEALEGNVRFARGVNPGDRFLVSLVCMRTSRSGNTTTTSSFWSKVVEAKAVVTAGGDARVPFRIEVPGNLPPSGEWEERRSHAWKIEVRPANKPTSNPSTLDIELAPAALDAPQVEPEKPPPLQPELVSALKSLDGADLSTMTPDQRAAIAKLSPGQQQAIASLVRNGPMLKKLLIGVVILFVAFQFLGGVVSLVAAFL